MPLSSDPGATAPFVLPGDKDKSPAPTFTCRFLTKRQCDEHRRLIEAAQGQRDAAIWDTLWQAIALGVIDWQNMPTGDTFSREALEALLTEREIMELAMQYPSAVSLAEDDRKNLSSPPLSRPESAAAALPVGTSTASGPAATAQT